MSEPPDRHEAHAVDLPFTVDRIDSSGRSPAHLYPEHPVNRMFLSDPTITAVQLVRSRPADLDEEHVPTTSYVRVDRPAGFGFGHEALDTAADLVCRTVARYAPVGPEVVWPDLFGREVDAVIDVVREFAIEHDIDPPEALPLIVRDRIHTRIRELRGLS